MRVTLTVNRTSEDANFVPDQIVEFDEDTAEDSLASVIDEALAMIDLGTDDSQDELNQLAIRLQALAAKQVD
jgi:hypothetical protein